MSIALSAIVRSSTGLRLLHAGFCACVAASAACCASPPLAALCGLSGVMGWLLWRAGAKAWRIDISGVGQIRLTVYQYSGVVVAAEPVQLLPGSTLWPGLLLLRLGRDDGRVVQVPVLPDSVARDGFRALALACRAVAGTALPTK